MSGSGGRHSRWTLTHTRCSGTTSTSSTHSDVQTHIPPVGSWSWVRICEICQPMGDWVIEEFDSERNILLPWWWTRGNNTRIQQHWGLAGGKREDWSLIEATKKQQNLQSKAWVESLSSPLQGSFFTRNSSRAIQPPPTRTITVLRKIRTRRSCWESPNCEGEEERVRYEGPHSVSVKVKKKKKLCKYRDQAGFVEFKSSMQKQITHTESLCKLKEPFLFQIYTKRIRTRTHSEVSFPTTQSTQRSIQLVYICHAGAHEWPQWDFKHHKMNESARNYYRCSWAPLDGSSAPQCASKKLVPNSTHVTASVCYGNK